MGDTRRFGAALLGAGLVLAAAPAAAAVTFATVAWPPYYGPKLEDRGFTAVLAKKAFARQGIDYRVDFMPWSRAMAAVESGQFAGLHGAFRSAERAKIFHSSDRPLYTARTVLLAHARLGRQSYDSLQDLKGLRIGVFQDYAYPQAFANADFLDKHGNYTNKLNLRQLYAGRLDLVAGGEAVLKHLAHTQLDADAGKLHALQPPLGEQGLFMLAPKDEARSQKLLAAFDKGLKSLKQDGTYEAVLKRYKVR